jgi:hypothetical protein
MNMRLRHIILCFLMMVFFTTVQGFASPCNNREVVSASGSVQQVTRSTSGRLQPKGRKNYYPFGAPYADPVAVMGADLQPYKTTLIQ